jgi:hypothetical protein
MSVKVCLALEHILYKHGTALLAHYRTLGDALQPLQDGWVAVGKVVEKDGGFSGLHQCQKYMAADIASTASNENAPQGRFHQSFHVGCTYCVMRSRMK